MIVARRPARSAQILSFMILGQHVQITCRDTLLTKVVLANYGSLVARLDRHRVPDLRYVVARRAGPNPYSLACRGRPAVAMPDIGDLLFHLDRDLTVALQQRRPDLLFLHAAALEHGGRACLLAGESGHGKSTTSWGLLHHGFRYLSDELSPIDLDSLQVLPFARALCLKQLPPAAYPLPATDVLDFGRTIRVPVQAMPDPNAAGPCELAAVLFVRHRKDLLEPVLRAIGCAEASARMYAVTLNALAHSGQGLDAVVRIAEQIPCFSLESADLRPTCDIVSRLLVGVSPQRAPRQPAAKRAAH